MYIVRNSVPTTMQAAVRRHYGDPASIELATVDVPSPAEGHVLIQVVAAGVNPLDWHLLTGTPLVMRPQTGLRRPATERFGADLAGIVVAVGAGVTDWAPGDEVFGAGTGAFAEYATAKQGSIARKPPELSFEQAAALPIAGLTALQALRDKLAVGPGTRLLINGAGGGVGTLAVQLALAAGASVTAVCGPGNVERIGALGHGDHAIDYTVVDYTVVDVTDGEPGRFDAIVDNVGNHPLRRVRRLLRRGGSYVMVAGSKRDRWLGPLPRLVRAIVSFRIVGRRAIAILAATRTPDLDELARLVVAGTLRQTISATYPLSEVGAALAQIGTGHTPGKLVVAVGAHTAVTA